MMRTAILSLLLFGSLGIANAQQLKGKVIGKTSTAEEPLIGATVHWLNTTIGTATDVNGQFQLLIDSTQRRLVVSFIGYNADTITITNQTYITVKLKESNQLKEVQVVGERDANYISLDPVKTEVITQKELAKSACCDLSGCFETNGTVQPTTTNILTNAKELRILGLSGVYNQILIDGMPMIIGATQTYGISSIPGTLVDNIYVAKGSNSILQGFEAISGNINVTLKEPDKSAEKILVNLYANSFWEKHLNANYAKRWKKWSNLAAFHMVQPSGKFDRDGDKFLDLPLLTRYSAYNKLKYSDEDSLGFSSMIALRYLDEQRIGGQTSFDPERDKGSDGVFGQTVSIKQPEIYTKTGYKFNERNRLVFMGAGFAQFQQSYYGTTSYDVEQTNFYGNLQYELKYRKHELKTGVSYRYMNLDETIGFTSNILNRTYAGRYLKTEMIPGVFAENIMNWKGDRITLITGARLDHHNQFGLFFTPRTMLKWQVATPTTIRISAGTGYRTVNLFSENIGLLASSRDVIITEQLKPERALNVGTNIVHRVDWGKVTGNFTGDFYHTRFFNQVFPDYDTDPTKAYVSNFTGESVSNGFQLESNFKFFKVVDVKAAYNFLDVYRKQDAKKEVLPFNSRHKITSAISYEPRNKRWHADMNVHWFGEQRLPNTSSNPVEFRQPERSQPYTVFGAQFTKVWKKFEAYAGCENIFDFRQKQPIVSWQDPFSPYFDTAFVWGPTRGREIYAGMRYKIKYED